MVLKKMIIVKNYFITIALFLFWISAISKSPDIDEQIYKIYSEIGIEGKLDKDVFRLSMIGFNNLQKEKQLKNPSIITIIDYSKPSTTERLFVIDLENKKTLHTSLVAHGKNSGWEIADRFSNISGSLMSSLGFYLTDETYYGKHGYSLRLKGLESSFNDKAEDRAIVIHKAHYVSMDFIKKYGRLGRSWGCPALPVQSAHTIIDEIKSGTCLFIYAENDNYLENSRLLNEKPDKTKR
jgi:hypothetical protein